MPIKVSADGTIKMYRGDTGTIRLCGIPTDDDYTVCFAIQNASREPIGDEIKVHSAHESEVKIKIDQVLSNKLKVEGDKKLETYYYGVKVCSSDKQVENTAFVGGNDFGMLNKIVVYPLKCEGV